LSSGDGANQFGSAYSARRSEGGSSWPTSSRGCFAKSTAKSGAHFRLEEEALCPSLADVFEAAYIENLPVDHDRAIGTADALVGTGDLSAADSRRAANLVRLPEERPRTVMETRVLQPRRARSYPAGERGAGAAFRQALAIANDGQPQTPVCNAGAGGSLPFRTGAFPRRAPPQETAKWPGPAKNSA